MWSVLINTLYDLVSTYDKSKTPHVNTRIWRKYVHGNMVNCMISKYLCCVNGTVSVIIVLVPLATCFNTRILEEYRVTFYAAEAHNLE